jgi:hypothetical protein
MARCIVYQDISKPVNRDLLAHELRAALQEVFISVRSLDNGLTRLSFHAPTEAEVVIATQIVQAHNPDQLTDSQQTLTTIRKLIVGSVGKNILELSDNERWALLAGLLYQSRAITPEMTVRHPKAWIVHQDTEED